MGGKKFVLFLLSLLVGIILFFWIGKTVGWQEIKNAFLVFTKKQELAIFSLTLLMMMIGTLKWRAILKDKGITISFLELFQSYLGGFAVMFFAPVLLWAGEIFRSYVLKERKQISWTKATASVIIDRVLEWTTNLVIISLGVLFFLHKISFPPKNLGLIFGGAFLLFAGMLSLFYVKTFRKESLAKAIGSAFNYKLDSKPLSIEKEVFVFFKLKKKLMWQCFGLSALRVIAMYLRAWLLIGFLEKDIARLAALSIVGFNLLAAMIPIPASLGSHEAIQVFAFDALGLGASTATAFTLIIRGTEAILAFVGVIILFQFGFFVFKENLLKKIGKLVSGNQNEL